MTFMKKIETLFIGVALIGAITIVGGSILRVADGTGDAQTSDFRPTSEFGAFLAAQHAIYVNDFNRATDFSHQLTKTEYPVVQTTKIMSEFLSGTMPGAASLLESEKGAPARMIYDAYLGTNGKWDELYKRHKSNKSPLTAPFRIWAAVAIDRVTETMKFIDTLPTNASWKSFVRGQIYATRGNTEKAAAEFANVQSDFMNLYDYMYIMSFYRAHDMVDAADALHDDFTSRPGGMFIMDYDDIPTWEQFAGYKNALGFSLVQNVSHTQILMYSDLAIMMLRTAQTVSPGMGLDSDAINYYTGQYFYSNHGDYEYYFNRISRDSPFYPFAQMRIADKTGDASVVKKVLADYPLFVPAVNSMIAHHISTGERRSALRVVNRALADERLSDASHAFFLKSRAQIHYVFGDYDAAAADLHAAADVLPNDPEILALQAKIWAAQNREIETAYGYAMQLVMRAPSDVFAWDTLGRVVAVREGTDAALDILQRVGEVATTCSALFEHLGDLHAANGDSAAARDAYNRAIEMADDGLVVVPTIKKKLRKLK